MNKLLIWDIPTRLFHWAFAASLSAALGIGFLVDDDSPLFQFHMLFGLVAAFLLLLRIVLGLIGSRHARFSRFPLRPAEIAGYFTGVFTGKTRRYAGNNPGSALAALAMFVLVPLLVFTGIGTGGEAFDDIHEVLAFLLLGAIGAHLLGLIVHTLRHRENIAAAMITGRKIASPDEALKSAHPIWGMLLLITGAVWIVAFFANHDANAATVRLPLLGAVVPLGENDSGEHKRERDHPDSHRSGKNDRKKSHHDD
jgi:cytochrome b